MPNEIIAEIWQLGYIERSAAAQINSNRQFKAQTGKFCVGADGRAKVEV